ncbi:site-specific integrase [Prevotella sp. oral taxon 475]|uniref:site-specific integrase n=1 Tax=Prevotella sp. oral taxon 475 TaxID=712471 RepID=UPI001BA6631E|nr:site-specific integrase [Prevotella sp. oral taxon 475]QUB47962.1 site-specific integrase [Prevotella sp. oral taxon 475]
MKSTFSVIFYLKKNKVKKDGTSPIMGRITVDGTQAQFSCKVSIEAKLWGIKGGRAIGKSITARDINRALDKLRAAITKHYQEIMERDNFVTAEKVRNAFQGLEYRKHTLITLYDDFLTDYAQKVECGLKSKRTLQKYHAVYKHLKSFLQTRHHLSDIALKEIQPTFATDLETFLLTYCHLSHNTVWLYSFPVRMLMHRAVENGWLVRYPFSDYNISQQRPERVFLTKEEIRLLIGVPKLTPAQTFIRDMFLFCTFTGLAYIDLKNLREENIVRSPLDGDVWIRTRRQKTSVEVNVKLLDIPLQILEKYSGLSRNEYLFPIPSHVYCCNLLKTIMKKCGIDKHVTWHVARHTMATVVCLSNGMPIESVSSLLGHKCITSTQIYAKITNEKLGREMDTLSTKLTDISNHAAATLI